MKKLKLFQVLLMLNLVLSLLGCQTTSKNSEIELTGKNPSLSYQILSPREGHFPFLTNRAGESIVRHDLSLSEKREALRELNFFCKVGATVFHICKGTNGLCRKTNNCAKWEKKWHYKVTKKKKCIEREYIVHSLEKSYNYLIAVGARCASLQTYPNFLQSL